MRARAAVVMDANTGAFIYTKHPDERLPPASTTKVMTALLALESGRLEETAVVSRAASLVQPTKLYLRPGDRMRLGDLTLALLLKSANDASVVVAEALGGSVSGFAAGMNRRAEELGARNTRFVNPNGLPARGHYSTARDLALIFQYAAGLPDFRKVASTSQKRVTAWRRSRRSTFNVRNKNRLLRGYKVPVIGKTGYTRAAKRCYVGSARANGREVVVALLGSTDLWGDARRLLDFGLEHATPTEMLAVSGKTRGRIMANRTELGQYSLVLTPIHNSREAAERLRHFIGRRGHEAVVESIGPAPQRQYLVRVLGLRNREAALRAGAELQAEHLEPTIVPPG